MMLVGGARDAPLRVALVTTHLPLADVPAALTRRAVRETLDHRRARPARAASASQHRASPSAGSIRMPAKAAISGARRSTSIAPAIADGRARRIGAVRGAASRRHGVRARACARLRRDRRDVSRPGAAGAQGGELRARRQRDARACRFRARRSITARRSTLRSTPRARRRRIPEASSRRSTSRSTCAAARPTAA